jgi:LPXTG-motif cell wall-anchored protein
MRRIVPIGLAGALALLVSASLSGIATAQVVDYPPGSGATIALSDAEVSPGQSLTISGTGFLGGSDAAAQLNPPLGSARVDGSGRFSLTATIPVDTSLGAHTITVSGIARDGVPVTRSAAVTVVAPGDGGTGGVGAGRGGEALPRTGTASTTPLTAAGVGLVLIGAFAVATARRRRTAQAIDS